MVINRLIVYSGISVEDRLRYLASVTQRMAIQKFYSNVSNYKAYATFTIHGGILPIIWIKFCFSFQRVRLLIVFGSG